MAGSTKADTVRRKRSAIFEARRERERHLKVKGKALLEHLEVLVVACDVCGLLYKTWKADDASHAYRNPCPA